MSSTPIYDELKAEVQARQQLERAEIKHVPAAPEPELPRQEWEKKPGIWRRIR